MEKRDMMVLDKIKNGLIVSCQALEDEPLHNSYIMGKMALAAKKGGAVGIRANSKEDIAEIKKMVNLPIIGIVKRNYKDSNVYITPTMEEVDELVEVGVDIVAIDATNRKRPYGKSLGNFVKDIREKYSNIILMADISNFEEAIKAEKLGFDIIATTLVGYTEYSREESIDKNDFDFLKKIITNVNIPVIAEGKIDTPQKAKRCLELGTHSVVVGSAITRPQIITKKFVDEIKK
ncbi:N-acetylmannosamine-6-phosphate 2-epimerase [Anaerosalibacter massiliensis]|uniref:Putative N-acetylmannosamine-6-phosphate 2-epimerase n=1 Tax=Anaerosalibacter massiliensis TaxID=1347392 RepID=A0A9X2S5A3_9FIRM|nr:N-acetylmannosamine-6-phosphate 2-epimerase [Anaerosalibacter massiliensis]MCR2044400.1 N-acetylmannosamine-6-phosphate 2-epimerase [Anaerosalibacter massiliensis]